MKHILIVIFAIALIVVLSACNTVKGNGNIVTEEYDVTEFNRIDFSGIGEVFVTVGEAESATVRTDENILELLLVEVRDNTLHIGQADISNGYEPTALVFTLTVPELTGLEVSGAGSVRVNNLTTDSFSVDASGASDIELNDVDVDTLSIEISGVGEISAEGRAGELSVDISGAGSFNGFDLEVDNARVEVSGAGSIEVNVSGELSGNISGAGEVTYRGNPSVTVETSGVGSVSED